MLGDITVVELGQRVSTAYCGKLLVDAGATVVKIEEQGGDPLRGSEPAYAAYLLAGKRSVTADSLASAAALGDRVDVVIRDSDEADAGRQVAAWRDRNPDLVVVTLSDYGLDGPAASTPATEFTLQAEAGITVLRPTGDRPPVATSVQLAELTSGVSAAMGTVMALLGCRAGAPGIDVDVSRFEALVSLLQYPWLFAQSENHYPYLIPQNAVPGIERAKDGWVCVVSVTEPQWNGFKEMAGVPGLADERFNAFSDRVKLGKEVTALVRSFTERHTIDELVELGAAHRVPIVPVGTPRTLAELVPYASRNTYVRNEAGADSTGGFLQPRPPFRVDNEGDWVPKPPPRVGEDNGAAWGPRPVRQNSTADGTDPRRPLEGLRVVEFGTFQAGPLVGSALASLGADVIKVEAVSRPDLIRFTGCPPTVDRFWERSGQFLGPNTGKRAVTVDLADPRGVEIARKLIAGSDVMIENFVPRVLDSRGLGQEGVRALRPDIVMVRMPAWGLTGPWRDRPGFTYTADAAAGLSEMSGYPDGEPLLTGTIVDPLAALVTTFVTVAAILRRRRTGEGAFIEVPLCDVAPQLTARPVIEASRTGRVGTRTGNRSPYLAPQGMYRCADGAWAAVSVATDRQWKALATLPAVKAWAADERFADHSGRRGHEDELDQRLGEFCATTASAELVATLRDLGVPAAVLRVGDDFAEHPQLLARHRVYELDHPVTGSAKHIGPAMTFSHAPVASAPRNTPLFGQDNHDVLRELGYSEPEIQSLTEDGVLGDAPFGLPFDRRS
ncbi:CoA transferase [Streptomyces sp. GbtcB7]|uniref:CaiB/BaiF CoA-transferase family protein n=1 Tax=Streptomyces sp. GbtcB7 TaxID=2824752 RepID=UPI001C302372|nr:CoA transferase [Streptomyces sp. GbtcB7]